MIYKLIKVNVSKIIIFLFWTWRWVKINWGEWRVPNNAENVGNAVRVWENEKKIFVNKDEEN